jgi:hypothetical protein
MATHPISTSVNFNGGGVIDFNSSLAQEFANTAGFTGALVYNDASNNMVRLAIGTAGQVLTVTGGLPSWQPSAASSVATMLAKATAQLGTVASGDTWVTVNNAVVTWNDAANGGNDTGSAFATATGVYTVPATGVFQFSAGVHFQPLAFGNGSIVSAPTGLASRQLRIRKTNGSPFTIGLAMRQAEAFGPSAGTENPTALEICAACASVTSGDTIELQVRQDSGTALNLEVTDGQTWFSIHRCS